MSLLLLALAACTPDRCKEGDADADGFCADADCDDADPAVHTLTAWYADDDGDAFGRTAALQSFCHDPGDGWAITPEDCDDTSAAIHPGADEVCNGIDDDCSGEIDDIAEGTTWYPDGDGDGYGTESGARLACDPPPGYATVVGDCNDVDAAVHPGAREVWNGHDDDCDGVVDAMTLAPDDLDAAGPFARLRGEAGAPLGAVDTVGGGADVLGAGTATLAVGSAAGAGNVWLVERARLSGDDLVGDVASASVVGAGGDALGAVPWQLGDLVGDGAIDLPLSSCAAGRVDLFAGPLSGDVATLDAWGTVDVRDPGVACHLAYAWFRGAPTLVVADPVGVRGGCEAGNGSVYLFTGGVDEGWAWAWDGGATGPAGEIDGSQTTCVDGGEHLGAALAVADVDADGEDELVLGAPTAMDGTETIGAVYVARSPSSPDPRKSEQVSPVRLLGDEGATLGSAGSVARPADLDGDGVPELVFASAEGERVYVWTWSEGATDLRAADVATVLHVPGEEAPTGVGYGAAVATVDLDGSGLADVIVGVPGDGGDERGAVWVYGDGFYPAEVEVQPTAILYGTLAGEALGTSLAPAGDADGDGIGDLLVGAPGCCGDGETAGEGAVYLLSGVAGWWGERTPEE